MLIIVLCCQGIVSPLLCHQFSMDVVVLGIVNSVLPESAYVQLSNYLVIKPQDLEWWGVSTICGLVTVL